MSKRSDEGDREDLVPCADYSSSEVYFVTYSTKRKKKHRKGGRKKRVYEGKLNMQQLFS